MKKRFSLLLFIVAIIFSLSVYKEVSAIAGQALTVPTPTAELTSIPETTRTITESIWESLKKAAQTSFVTLFRSAINQYAYETATWLGSGDHGQKPVYHTKGFGQFIRDTGANAGGQFVEDFLMFRDRGGSDGDIFNTASDLGVDICAPSITASLQISLGLTDYLNESRGIPESKCNLTNIWQNLAGSWDDAFGYEGQGVNHPHFWNSLAQTAFNPATTHVGAAATLFGVSSERVAEERGIASLERIVSGEWKNPSNLLSGWRLSPPDYSKGRYEMAEELVQQNIFQQTGNAIVDAANIFLNQYALTAFNKFIASLSKQEGPGDFSSSFFSQGSRGGINQIAQRSNRIMQTQFNEKVDYDVLSEMISCPDPQNPGPTNCVITQPFSQAISRQLTIGDAVKQGLIEGDKRIGYDQSGNDLDINNGYPYRSLIILRKYRILPVGFEVAADYIKNNSGETRFTTLQDLIDCYDGSDSYEGSYDTTAWCKGLIDPNWTLKMPRQFCGMIGYGPTILSQQTVPKTRGVCVSVENCHTNTAGCETNYKECTNALTDCTETPYTFCNFNYAQEVNVARAQSYCADEQACIKENPNGTCAFYGYCTEERRRWVFGQASDNSCEARNNSCSTFRGSEGQTVSYLQNTLSYDNCGPDEVGCKRYATIGTYNQANSSINWTGGERFFNAKIESCDSGNEGCHSFIRTESSLDVNLIADGSFEESLCIVEVGGGVSDNSDNNNEVITKGKLSWFDSLIKGAVAQNSLASCLISNFSSSGNLPSPNNHWYIRVAPGQSAKAGVTNSDSTHASQSLYVEGQAGLYSKLDGSTPSLLPAGFSMEGDVYYSLAAAVKVLEGKVRIGFGGGENRFVEIDSDGVWETRNLEFYNPSGVASAIDFYIEGTDGTAKFYIDSVKLSKGRAELTYKPYGQGGQIYQKLLPAYLEALCYENVQGGNFSYKDNAPDECFDFARKCGADEVGCERYTSLKTNISLTAKTKPYDLCPGSCLGYDTYVRQADDFNRKENAHFIPNTASFCSAQAVGCTAFTNLDKLGQGAEAIEYYKSMRHCIKPDTQACGDFYTWEGSDDAGYQLRVFSLKRNGNRPASTMDPEEESQLCNEEIFKKKPGEPGYNFDCREFYTRDGAIFYHLYTKTISCSEDCHPYRRDGVTAQECTANGGQWDTEQARCLYYAIPSEGVTCSASEVGCGEYTGNIASNVRTAFYDSFEDANNPLMGWSPGSHSAVSLNLNGNSLLTNAPVGNISRVSKRVGAYQPIENYMGVNRNMSYTISFLAKAANPSTNVESILFRNDEGEEALFSLGSSRGMSTDWRLYTFNLGVLDHTPSPLGDNRGEELRLAFSNRVYIDDIRLTEVPDRYYLIKDSWSTPIVCDQDMGGNPSPRHMLGCSQYRKIDNSTVNLKSFSELCQDSAAGCEAMIDTQNSTLARARTIKGVEIPAHKMINVVYDRTKQCGADNKGCQRAGVGSTYETVTTYSDIYIRNNPDRYSSTVCGAESVGCSQWTGGAEGTGTYYFKDPGKEVCEWRLKSGTVNDYGWYKKDVKRCTGSPTGNICSSNADCGAGICQEVACTTTFDKTLGIGGANNAVAQPSEWAGLCEAAQSGCTEYLDPLSKFNANLVMNPTYAVNPPNTQRYDPWTPAGNIATQIMSLEKHKVYTLTGGDNDQNATHDVFVRCDAVGSTLYELNSGNNKFEIKTGGTTRSVRGKDSVQFYVISSSPQQSVACTLTRNNTNPIEAVSVSLKEAIVAYQLKQNLDYETPNGLVNFNKGHILFNERSYGPRGLTSLRYNANRTSKDEDSVDGVSPLPADTFNKNNANEIIAVTADRVCGQWLSCRAYVTDPQNPNRQVCVDVGLCNELDSEGRCNNFVNMEAGDIINQTNSSAIIHNMTGYSKVGYSDGSAIVSQGAKSYYNLGAMRQVGAPIKVENGSFERYEDASWQGFGHQGSGDNAPFFKYILHPAELSAAGLNSIHKVVSSTSSYLPPEGVGMGEVKKNSSALQKKIDFIENGQTYIISAYLYAKSLEGEVGIKLCPKPTNQLGGLCTTELLVSNNNSRDEWKRVSASFRIENAGEYQLELFNSTGASAYFDDIRIQSSLAYRCNTDETGDCPVIANSQTGAVREFLGPSCRLYPNVSAAACRHIDNNRVEHKGIQGYCLETDPKNPGTCLMWYPLDRIASELNDDELTPVVLENGLFYCIKAQDRCDANNNDKPTLDCEEVIVVNIDKYWYNRLRPDSQFTIGGGSSFWPANNGVIADDIVINVGNSYRTAQPAFNGRLTFDEGFKRGSIYGAGLNFNEQQGVRSINLVQGGTFNSFVPYWFREYKYQVGYDLPGTGSHSAWSTSIGEPQNRQVCLRSNWDEITAPNGTQSEDIPHDSGFALMTRNAGGGSTGQCNHTNCFCNGGPCPQIGFTWWSYNNNSDYTKQKSAIEGDGISIWFTNGNDNKIRLFRQGESANTRRAHAMFGDNIKDYYVATSRNAAIQAIKRLFITDNKGVNGPNTGTFLWKLWRWEQGSYQDKTNELDGELASFPLRECPSTGRPDSFVQDSDPSIPSDYCYVRPLISDFRIPNAGNNGVDNYQVSGRGEDVTFSLNTKTDSEQLPIEKVEVDFGFKDSLNEPVTRLIAQRAGDNNPRIFSQRLSYHDVNNVHNNPSDPAERLCAAENQITKFGECPGGSGACCIIKPKVKITDNWGYSNEVSYGGTVVLRANIE